MKSKDIYFAIARNFAITALIIIRIPNADFPVLAVIAGLCLCVCVFFLIKGVKCGDSILADVKSCYRMFDNACWITYGLILILLLF